MKLSDKLLILVILAAFVIVGSAHLSLYSRYKKGLWVVEGKMTVDKSFPAPAHLVVDGFYGIVINHADSFSIEYDNPGPNAGGPVRRKEVIYGEPAAPRRLVPFYKGDTMLISGYDSVYPFQDQLVRIPSRRITINSPNISSITLEGGNITLTGDASAAHAFSAHLLLKNVEFAQALGRGAPPYNSKEFNQLSVECINSRIDLDDKTHVQQLQLQLDKSSSASLRARIDELSLQYDDESHIELSGVALRGLSRNPKPETAKHP